MSQAVQPIKVVHLTSTHPYYDTRVFGRECRSLAAHGYDVVLITPSAEGTKPPEVLDGVRIKPVLRGRGRATRMTTTVRNVYHSALEEDAAVYHFHDPELLFAGLLLRARGKRVIYDSHEDEPQQIRYSKWIPRGFRSLAGCAFEGLERFAARRFTAVVTANGEISARFKKYTDKVVELNNYPIEGELGGYLAPERPRTENLVVNFGGISPHTVPDAIVEAMERLPQELQASLVLGGHIYSESLLHHCSSLPGWNRVQHTGKVNREEMMQHLERASVAIVLYCREPNQFGVGSNRFFESLAAGLPVITPDFPNWRKIVEEIGCGIPVSPEEPQQIADAITYLLTHGDEAIEMGKRGQDAVINRLNWCKEESKLVELYENLLTVPEMAGETAFHAPGIASASVRASVARGQEVRR